MRRLLHFWALVLCLLPLAAADRISLDEYRNRRTKLREATGDAVTIVFGGTEAAHGDIRHGFFQEANFYYLTGWTEPGAVLVMTPSEEVLLIPRRDPAEEKWTGPKLGPADPNVKQVTGFSQVGETESFEAELPKWLGKGKKIFALKDDAKAQGLKSLLPNREFDDVTVHIARLRQVKSKTEIALIQRATSATMDAHLASWKAMKPGITEFKIASIMMDSYFQQGCERNAYVPIVGAGPNGAILHYAKNKRTVDTGQLVLMDVGAECDMYASDLTRTVPANGKFNARQKELYDIVLGAHKAVIAAIKPGMILRGKQDGTLHRIAVDYFAKYKDKAGKGLDEYFTHGVGHHVGLDVHDANDPVLPLAAGMVVTVEPGLYLPDEGIGIRIEDVVLVTDKGAEVLSSKLPVETQDIEKFFANRK